MSRLVVRHGKRIPRGQLCPHCRLRRVAKSRPTCRHCSRPRTPPPPLFPKPEPFRPSLEALQAQAEADALARWPRKDVRPKVKQPPLRYKSPLCWNCQHPKLKLDGTPLPSAMLYCYECSMHPCQDFGCTIKAHYHANAYRDYCEAHHNERAYCKTCGHSKPYDGRELCSDCAAKLHKIYTTRLYRLHRKYHYMPPPGSMTRVPPPPNLISP